jgi:N-acetylglucosaminyl-diphospho-decaprenol L-rhamnosyltransferase
MNFRPGAWPADACAPERISLITTVRNEQATIADLIASIGAQSRAPDEWVVVDGGSTDRTMEMLARVPGCRVVYDPGNIAHGRNVAIAQTTGACVVATDAGCRPRPDFVEKITAPLQRGVADLAAGRTRPRIRNPLEAAQWAVMDQFAVDWAWWRRPALSARALAFRPEVWRDRAYPEILDHGEDAWLIEEWRRRGWRLAVVPDAEVEWYLPATWRAFVGQGFRYMRADGQARMGKRRHAMRTAFYGLLGATTALGPLVPTAIWGLYLAATSIRFPLATSGRSLAFRLRTAAWMPALLLSMDLAKLAGYWTGRLERRRRQALRSLAWSTAPAEPPVTIARPPAASADAPTLAIAVVHYHADDMLRRCVNALAASTLRAFEVCVVDNGSADGVAWAAKADPRVQVVALGQNLGFAAGTNLALRHLSQDTAYIALLNPDVFVEPTTLARAVAAFDDPSIGVVTGKLVRLDGDIDHACRRSEPDLLSGLARELGLDRLFPKSRRLGAYAMTYADPDQPRDVDSGSAAFLVIRRALLEHIGPCLDERFFLYGEDLDLCRRARNAGYRVVYRPEVRAVHVKGSGRVRDVHATVRFYHAMWIYYRKWGRHRRNPLVLAPLAAALVGLGTTAIVSNAVRATRRQADPSRAR